MKILYLAILTVFLFACNSSKQISTFKPSFLPGPPVIVYKTKADYSKNVPILLSDDKTKIVSYPAPQDLKLDNNYKYPNQSTNNYWIDIKGIGKNVAFIKLTYEEYSKLNQSPTINELYSIIIDKEPLLEMYNCGNKTAFTNVDEQIKELIKSNKLKSTCKVLK